MIELKMALWKVKKKKRKSYIILLFLFFQEFEHPLPTHPWNKELWDLLDRTAHFLQRDELAHWEGTSLDTTVVTLLPIMRTLV